MVNTSLCGQISSHGDMTRGMVRWPGTLIQASGSAPVASGNLSFLAQLPTGISFGSRPPLCTTWAGLMYLAPDESLTSTDFHSCPSAVSKQLEDQKFRARRTLRSMPPSIDGDGGSQHLDSTLDRLDRVGTRLDLATYASLLRRCGNTKALSVGKRIHDHILKDGHEPKVFLNNLLMQMYGDCGALRDARLLFGKMQKRDVFSWNFMIKACTRLGLGEEALQLFTHMQREAMMPDQFILASALSACASEVTIAEGKRLHARVAGSASESDVVLGTALINMYGKCGCLDDAQNMFNKMPQRDVVSWTAMIEAYCKDGLGKEALNLYDQMQRDGVMPDRFIMVSILSACASQAALTEGREMHAHIKSIGFESDIVVGNALVNMYGKCSNLEEARMVFERMPEKDVISWNAMIGVFTQNGRGKCALGLFEQMQQKGVKPDKVTFVSILDSCASLGAVTRGKEIHHGIMGSEFESDVVIGTAAVNMYGKCACLEDALKTFDKMPMQDMVLWNALIAAYAQNGQSKDALLVFYQMQCEGVAPDEVTYISVLSACSHAGFIDEGWRFFGSMTRKHGIIPIADHYNCLIDLLGRAGRLNEADNLIGRMSVQPTAVSWLTLLGACRNQVDVERGECVAKHLFELDPQNATPYIILSSIYAAVDREDDAAKAIDLMRAKGLKKPIGCSSIEVEGIVNEFWTDDQSHPQKEEIYTELETLSRLMEEGGYTFKVNGMMNKLEGKEDKLCVHSERIAIAFGLISTAPKTRLFVTKNLRMCSDCHSASKFISKITYREIVVRDAKRFHYMKDGLCSCADYW